MNRAVFLDRDGTLLDDPGYLGNPAQVRLLPGVPEALHDLAAQGYLRVVITNQSGIARGMLDASQVESVHHEVERQLGRSRVSIDGWFYCPHAPEDHCDCRKPGTLLHRQAAEVFNLDLRACWCIGDRLSDVAAAAELEGRALLVRTGDGERHAEEARNLGIAVVADLQAAADHIRQQTGP